MKRYLTKRYEWSASFRNENNEYGYVEGHTLNRFKVKPKKNEIINILKENGYGTPVVLNVWK